VNVRSYLITSGRNRAYNAWRDAKRKESAREKYEVFARLDGIPQPLAEGPEEQERLRGMLNRAIQGLRDEEREVVLLHIHGNLTFRETAETVGAPPNTVATRYRRAIEKIRTQFNKELEEGAA
jgi:RNA polymerase sigma-70 factor (ECF subfamily)